MAEILINNNYLTLFIKIYIVGIISKQNGK